MTRDDIIRMAQEAGIDAEQDTLCRYEGWVEPIEKFAALVAAAEREKCVKELKIHGWGYASKTLSAKGNNGL